MKRSGPRLLKTSGCNKKPRHRAGARSKLVPGGFRNRFPFPKSERPLQLRHFHHCQSHEWRFPLYPGYLCALFKSENDTLLTGGFNTTGYDIPAFDSQCDRFLAETDALAAQEQAYQLQVMLADDRPYIPLFYPQVMDMTRENVILPFLPDLGGITGAGGMQTDIRVLNK